MTPTSIEHAIQMSFTALYPRHVSLNIEGAGDELITVRILVQGQPALIFEAELDSDDDGFFHFLLQDCLVQVLVPYPES